MKRAILALALVLPAQARADTKACVAAHVSVQEQRLAGDLRGAQASAARCATDECPAALRSECARWTEDIESELPALEIRVRGAAQGAAPLLEVDGQPQALDAAPIRLNPGHHSIEVRAAGRSIRRSVHLLKGDRDELVIDIPAPPAPSPVPPPATDAGPPIGPIVLGAVGVAGLAVFGIMGGLGVAEYGALEASCAPRCTEEQTSVVDDELLAADVALGVGSAALLAGTVWLVVELVGRGRPPVEAASRGLSFTF